MQTERYVPTEQDIEQIKNLVEQFPIGIYWMTDDYVVKVVSKNKLILLPTYEDEQSLENIRRFGDILQIAKPEITLYIYNPSKETPYTYFLDLLRWIIEKPADYEKTKELIKNGKTVGINLQKISLKTN